MKINTRRLRCKVRHERETYEERKLRLLDRRRRQDQLPSIVTTAHARGMKARRDLTLTEINRKLGLSKYIPAGEFKNTQDRPKAQQRKYGGKLVGMTDPTVKPKRRRSPTGRVIINDSPEMQNIPTRTEEVAKIKRAVLKALDK